MHISGYLKNHNTKLLHNILTDAILIPETEKKKLTQNDVGYNVAMLSYSLLKQVLNKLSNPWKVFLTRACPKLDFYWWKLNYQKSKHGQQSQHAEQKRNDKIWNAEIFASPRLESLELSCIGITHKQYDTKH